MTAQKHGDFQKGYNEGKHLFILSACHKKNSAYKHPKKAVRLFGCIENGPCSSPNIILVIFLMSSKRFVAAGWSVKMLQQIYLTDSRNALSHDAQEPKRPNEPKHPNELRHHGPTFQLILYPESMFLLDRDKPAQREVQEWVEESFGLRL